MRGALQKTMGQGPRRVFDGIPRKRPTSHFFYFAASVPCVFGRLTARKEFKGFSNPPHWETRKKQQHRNRLKSDVR
jgi:hypothetical protein